MGVLLKRFPLSAGKTPGATALAGNTGAQRAPNGEHDAQERARPPDRQVLPDRRQLLALAVMLARACCTLGIYGSCRYTLSPLLFARVPCVSEHLHTPAPL